MRSLGLTGNCLPPMPNEILYIVEHGSKPPESTDGSCGEVKWFAVMSYSFPCGFRKSQGSEHSDKTHYSCSSLEDHFVSDMYTKITSHSRCQ